jgi:hypothetical protein
VQTVGEFARNIHVPRGRECGQNSPSALISFYLQASVRVSLAVAMSIFAPASRCQRLIHGSRQLLGGRRRVPRDRVSLIVARALRHIRSSVSGALNFRTIGTSDCRNRRTNPVRNECRAGFRCARPRVSFSH